jgi:hypothetical protein
LAAGQIRELRASAPPVASVPVELSDSDRLLLSVMARDGRTADPALAEATQLSEVETAPIVRRTKRAGALLMPIRPAPPPPAAPGRRTRAGTPA